MSSSDAVMMDSPAQTPDPKAQSAASATHASSEIPVDILMAIDSHVNETSANAATGSWDTKKWREELQSVTNKLQHPHWHPSKKYRDPMSKPLVTRPNDLTHEMDTRLREYFQQCKAQTL